MPPMSYKLISEATGETLQLGSREWEVLRRLAATEGGVWKPQEGRDYTRGRISPEEASEMADSVNELLQHASTHPGEQTEETPRRPLGAFETWTRQEMLDYLAYTEESPLEFFSPAHRRHMGESFVRLASKGAFEVIEPER